MSSMAPKDLSAQNLLPSMRQEALLGRVFMSACFKTLALQIGRPAGPENAEPVSQSY